MMEASPSQLLAVLRGTLPAHRRTGRPILHVVGFVWCLCLHHSCVRGLAAGHVQLGRKSYRELRPFQVATGHPPIKVRDLRATVDVPKDVDGPNYKVTEKLDRRKALASGGPHAAVVVVSGHCSSTCHVRIPNDRKK
ncbi:hypothetical protein, unlikely [Trypanosoma congolense IL3000]|uniref:Uncharacterized protein n=1 Tax=Trypanosoma congolense (strain IL3000) TaxID=1068625 RepID=F9WGC4_TRYCI|nr:hypothetical protein, unlikely [Trypanosoma congolense IL3000]